MPDVACPVYASRRPKVQELVTDCGRVGIGCSHPCRLTQRLIRMPGLFHQLQIAEENRGLQVTNEEFSIQGTDAYPSACPYVGSTPPVDAKTVGVRESRESPGAFLI